MYFEIINNILDFIHIYVFICNCVCFYVNKMNDAMIQGMRGTNKDYLVIIKYSHYLGSINVFESGLELVINVHCKL